MNKFLGLLLLVSSASFADSTILVDESFKATFSHYGEIDQVLTCVPGFRGGYGTRDVLNLKNYTMALGLDVGTQLFVAESDIGPLHDPRSRGRTVRRPYAEGCKQAIDQLKQAISGKEFVEVEVHRRLVSDPNTSARTYRNIKGEVTSTTYITAEKYIETIQFDLGGFRFSLYRTVNGLTKTQ